MMSDRYAPFNKKYVNKSVYWKFANNVYFNKNNFSVITNLDTGVIPEEFINENGILKSESTIIRLFAEAWENSDDVEPCGTPDPIACKYQNLLTEIIKFYTQLQMAYNYINSDKCTGYRIPITWRRKWILETTRQQLDIFEAHDLYVYLFSQNNRGVGRSQFYKFFLICCKLQKYLYDNFKDRDNCHVKIDSDYDTNCDWVKHCNSSVLNKY